MAIVFGQKILIVSWNDETLTWSTTMELSYRDKDVPAGDPRGNPAPMRVDVSYDPAKSMAQTLKEAENMARLKVGLPPIP